MVMLTLCPQVRQIHCQQGGTIIASFFFNLLSFLAKKKQKQKTNQNPLPPKKTKGKSGQF